MLRFSFLAVAAGLHLFWYFICYVQYSAVVGVCTFFMRALHLFHILSA